MSKGGLRCGRETQLLNFQFDLPPPRTRSRRLFRSLKAKEDYVLDGSGGGPDSYVSGSAEDDFSSVVGRSDSVVCSESMDSSSSSPFIDDEVCSGSFSTLDEGSPGLRMKFVWGLSEVGSPVFHLGRVDSLLPCGGLGFFGPHSLMSSFSSFLGDHDALFDPHYPFVSGCSEEMEICSTMPMVSHPLTWKKENCFSTLSFGASRADMVKSGQEFLSIESQELWIDLVTIDSVPWCDCESDLCVPFFVQCRQVGVGISGLLCMECLLCCHVSLLQTLLTFNDPHLHTGKESFSLLYSVPIDGCNGFLSTIFEVTNENSSPGFPYGESVLDVCSSDGTRCGDFELADAVVSKFMAFQFPAKLGVSLHCMLFSKFLSTSSVDLLLFHSIVHALWNVMVVWF